MNLETRAIAWSTPDFDGIATPYEISPEAIVAELLSYENANPGEQEQKPSAALPLFKQHSISSQRISAGVKLFVLRKKTPIELTSGEPVNGKDSLDIVTGLPDRAALHGRLAARFQQREPFALLFIDLDGFKQVNDTLGHLAGDHTLRELASRMRNALRGHDYLARFGGDEFLAIVEGVASMESVTPLVARLQEAVKKPLVIEDQTRNLSASIGAALSTDGYETPEAMLHAADLGMYATRASQKPAQR